jgi:hypothetical protein
MFGIAVRYVLDFERDASRLRCIGIELDRLVGEPDMDHLIRKNAKRHNERYRRQHVHRITSAKFHFGFS